MEAEKGSLPLEERQIREKGDDDERRKQTSQKSTSPQFKSLRLAVVKMQEEGAKEISLSRELGCEELKFGTRLLI